MTRIFLAGATGAIGRRLVPALVANGYDLVGTTRDPAKVDALRASGAEPVVLDPLDEAAVKRAVVTAEPDVVMHQLTALSGLKGFKQMDRQFATTNRLRTRGVDILLSAARAAGARRFICQSFTGWPNARTGGPVATEEHPLDPDPIPDARESLAAVRHLEAAVTGAQDIEGVALRYGFFYGPGTGFEHGGPIIDMVRKRQFPIVGGGGGVWSLLHIDDAAAATVAAVTRGAPGIYNICDDEPAPVREWLPYLTRTLGAKPPMRMPAWLARPMLGAQGVAMMTEIRGSSNAKARQELDWTLTYPTWRDGFRTGLG